jgi:YHS domain-containing protein
MTTRSTLPRRQFFTKTTSIIVTAMAATAMPQFAFAYDEKSSSALNLDAKGVAVKGYDPVSYFLATGPMEGKVSITARHEGATYQFANTTNRDSFKANPAKYVPAFGGFCAMGTVFDKKLDVNPKLWRVVNDKLYLNIHDDAQTRWMEDIPGNISKADKNWVNIKNKVPNTL